MGETHTLRNTHKMSEAHTHTLRKIQTHRERYTHILRHIDTDRDTQNLHGGSYTVGPSSFLTILSF